MKPLLLTIALFSLAIAPPARAAESGVRLFMTGNSFHMKTVPALAEVIAAAGIEGHTLVGTMLLGGSRAITLWEKPDDANPAKAALKSGKVDVLTLCPWRQIPDPGVDEFVALALASNPNVRVTIQELWMAFVSPNAANPDVRKDVAEAEKAPTPWDEATGEKLNAIHADYFAALEKQITAINKRNGKPVLLCVPTGHAAIALREQIRLGKAPGIRRQAELFSDRLGHPGAVLVQLNAYCHFAVIYRQSPVGVLAPKTLGGIADADRAPLARLLQQLAWDAVKAHPLSGLGSSQ